MMLIALKTAILTRGFTQRGSAAQIPEVKLSDIVRGHTTATPVERKRLAQILGYPEHALFDNDARVEIRSPR